jgi:RNA polymerase sigma-70 factor (ECF subfamily)
LTQDVFLRAYKNLGKLHDPNRFAAWLVGIARHVCREWHRKRRRERHAMHRIAARQAADQPPCNPPEQRLVELRDQVAGLLAGHNETGPRLREKERLALHAYYLQERNVEEARAVLGLSRSGFYRVLASACECLRRTVQKREVHP